MSVLTLPPFLLTCFNRLCCVLKLFESCYWANMWQPQNKPRAQEPNRSSYVMLTLFVLFGFGSWSVYHYQYESLPAPLTAEQAGKGRFSEMEAVDHVKALAQLGPHPVGTDELDIAIKYVKDVAENIKNSSLREVEVELDQFHVEAGAYRPRTGLSAGKTLIYVDLNHIVLRITPKYDSEAKKNSILVSSHIDTVFSSEGAGDCSSCIAVMLELARGVSHWAHGFKHSVIFLFNTGEEEGLMGAHSFITQHPWSKTVRTAVDLEAMGIGGKSGIFQVGSHPWAVETFAAAAKYPSGNVMGQDLFASGGINSATDFQIYMEAGLSGLDFAYLDNTAVYHTKNDKVELLKPGSLQHLGENMLAYLLEAAAAPALPTGEAFGTPEITDDDLPIYFDVLGSYMIVYRWKFANMLYNSVIILSLLIWAIHLFMGGYTAAVALALSCLSVILMWVLSLSFSVLVAFILPNLCSSTLPYITRPWLVIGLFGCPSLLGALAGQHFGFLLLQNYLSHTYAMTKQTLSPFVQANLAKLEAERWLFKSGIMQWLFLLMMANYCKFGSSYIAFIWLVTPAFSYLLLEVPLSTLRPPKPLKIATLLIGLSVPIGVTSGSIIRIIGVLIGTAVRLDSNPGSVAEWMGNVIVSVVLAAVVCLMLVFLLSYAHLSGAKRSIIQVNCLLFFLSMTAVWSGVIPSFTEETARPVNVVHVVDTMGSKEKAGDLTSYVSLFSSTPGNLAKEINHINKDFQCGRDKIMDFVSFSVNYGCWSYDEIESGWSQVDIPLLYVRSDKETNDRVTEVSIDTKVSNRWSLAINAKEIAAFGFRVSGNSEDLVPMGGDGDGDGGGDGDGDGGWHFIRFAGGKNSPTKFDLTLVWDKNSSQSSQDVGENAEKYLIKLRTDVNRRTPKVERVLAKLPSWCSLFGKSTSPFTLAFLVGLPIEL